MSGSRPPTSSGQPVRALAAVGRPGQPGRLAQLDLDERKAVVDALGRSRELVRGNGVQVFAVIVVVFLLNFVVAALAGGASLGTAARIVADLIASTLTAAFAALASAVLYLEPRRIEARTAARSARPGPESAPSG